MRYDKFREFIFDNQVYVHSYVLDGYLESNGFDYNLIERSDYVISEYFKEIKYNNKIVKISLMDDGSLYIQKLGKERHFLFDINNIDKQGKNWEEGHAEMEYLRSDEFLNLLKKSIDEL